MNIPHALLGLALSVGALGLATQDTPPRPKEDKPLAVGDKAPAFVLNDQEGKLVRVGGKSEQWTVIAFYPKALTGG